MSRIFVLSVFLVMAAPAFALEPADPKADVRARALLDYLDGLPARQDKRILSGQFTDYGPSARLTLCEDAFKSTGHWPAMIGLDYCDFTTGGLHTPTVDRLAIDYARHGGIVTISTHLPNPANPKGGGLRDKGVDLDALISPGTETHTRWLRELDTMAAGLKTLQDAGVVVLWRPFHEMNGNWFWWGGKDPDAFIRIWKHMFEYFTKTKGLHHLLWVYSPNHGAKVASYYPGDRFVDIVGLDAYTDHVDPEHIRGYAELASLPKPFGFTEFGPHGASDPPGDYDYRRLLTGIRTHFPRTSFFLSWHAKWSLARNHHARELLDDSSVVNREDIPKNLAAPSQ
jgi:mannan endo-1,4-beta-mannosidase